MSSSTCRIWGHDGFDKDVLHNLARFYRGLGHRVAVGREPIAADLLVVQRAPDREVDFSAFRAVHVWDYVGTPVVRLLAGETVDERVTVFASSERRAAELRDTTAATVEVLVPPVDVDLWREPVGPLRHPVAHIGNFKPYYADGSDEYAARFLAAVDALSAEVWGSGWPAAPRRLGPLGQFRASGVYATADTALGMMYPFQRDVSFSGRFWHAPLNGCRLLSEPSAYAGVWPGVETTTYSPSELQFDARSRTARADLQEESIAFWRDHWDVAAAQVSAAAVHADKGRARFRWYESGVARGRLLAHRVQR